jgi:hypothetical protein
MSYKSLRFKIAGVSPLLMHNGQMVDPANEWVKAIKRISGKAKKTDADHEEIARLEWYGGLYTDGGKPCLPGFLMESALTNGARKTKRGKQAQAGIICPGNFELHFDGEAPVDELWAGAKHHLKVPAKVGQARVMRTRPQFTGWSAEIEIMYDPSLLNEPDLREILVTCGESIGLGDWRPKFGRFEVVS